MSTNLSQNVLPTRSLDSTAAPCRPVYVHLDRFGYATYSFATATAWILFDAFGTVRLTVSLSVSFKTLGIVGDTVGFVRGYGRCRYVFELTLPSSGPASLISTKI